LFDSILCLCKNELIAGYDARNKVQQVLSQPHVTTKSKCKEENYNKKPMWICGMNC